MATKALRVGLLILTVQFPAAAYAQSSVTMQRVSEPGEAGDLFVFVGEQVSYTPLEVDCGERCWVFDRWHTARYRVVKRIHGVPPGDEVKFSVAEHAPRVPFGHARFALVFVERQGDALSLVKYEQVPVYPTAELDFASCGPPGGGPDDFDEPLDSNHPPMRELEFTPPLIVDDAHRLSPFGRQWAHDPRWHHVEDDKVVCDRGVALDELVAHLVRNNEMLSVALPHLMDAVR